MTVKSILFLFVSITFHRSVCGVQHAYLQEFTGSPCVCPYSCMTKGECANRHSFHGTQEVLFNCGRSGQVCCPPIKYIYTDAFGRYERIENRNCTQHPVRNGQNHFVDKTNGYGFENSTSSPSPPSPPPPSPQELNIKEFFLSPSEFFGKVDQKPKKPPSPDYFETRIPNEPLHGANDSAAISQAPQSQSPMAPQNLTKPNNNSLASHKNFNLLPTEAYCGGTIFANRITEGDEVSLGEYPWMALTGIKDRYGNYRWNCGGTLINEWYVLTAAHCLVVDNRTIEFVRLGEHNLYNKTDCSKDICLEPPEDVPIAEVIPHENWNTTTIKNDIALIRLSRNPLLSGKYNIYPICLPTNIENLKLTPTSKFQIAGWGKTDWNADEGSNVLRKASISGVGRDECNICKDKKKQQYCPIEDTQLCVQGWKSVDVCKGDSGGPLMLTRLNVYQIGITSFKGSEYCGAENVPSIFTRVESYMPWILDRIRQ